MFKTGEAAYEFRRERWEARLEAEAEQGAGVHGRVPHTGEGITVPLNQVPDIDRYMFDLNGFFIIRGAVSPEQLAVYNAAVNANDPAPGSALGITAEEASAMMADPHSPDLKDLQQGFGDGIPALGTDACFDSLIDHPGWISHIRDFTDGGGTKMNGGGGVSCRWPGQASGVHGGGHNHNRTFGWLDPEEDADAKMVLDPGRPGGDQMVPKGKRGLDGDPGAGRFHCKTVSVLLALNDCPIGGGATGAVPGSHKSNIRHPYQDPDAGHPQLLWRSEEPFERRRESRLSFPPGSGNDRCNAI